MNIAIVVVAYNRPFCTKRLLNHLNASSYDNDCVDLVISIDKSESNNVEKIANNFTWKNGKKIIRTHAINLGLRKHILECGNLTKNYDAIVLFEDDILPSKYFYLYVKATVDKYKDEDKIAGISLYQHLWNVGSNTAFIPDLDPDFDNYFMQYAQSWGQVWTKKMWIGFMNWYQEHSIYIKSSNMPGNVNQWPESSWLKYQIKYAVDNDKYFVYPKYSFSTNCGDAGTHNSISSPHYQVPLLNKLPKEMKLSNFSESNIKYDVFFERIEIASYLNIPLKNICIDLYGLKQNADQKRYWLTLEHHDYKIVRQFGFSLKPMELNIFLNFEGNDIFLYDTETTGVNMVMKGNLKWKKLNYSNRDIRLEDIYLMTLKKTKNSLNIKLKKALKMMEKIYAKKIKK